MIDLVTPDAMATGPEVRGIASRTDALFAGDGYLLLDMHRVAADDLPMDNAAALLAGLENPTVERVASQVAALRRRLDGPESLVAQGDNAAVGAAGGAEAARFEFEDQRHGGSGSIARDG